MDWNDIKLERIKNLLLCQLCYYIVFIPLINEQYLVRRILCWLELIEFLTQWTVSIIVKWKMNAASSVFDEVGIKQWYYKISCNYIYLLATGRHCRTASSWHCAGRRACPGGCQSPAPRSCSRGRRPGCCCGPDRGSYHIKCPPLSTNP